VKCDYHTIGFPWIGQLKNWEVREGGEGEGKERRGSKEGRKKGRKDGRDR